MYEKEINLVDVSFIFLRKLASRECVLQGPKMLKINYSGGWGGGGGGGQGGPMSLAIWPRIFRLLGHCPTGQKFQNDHWTLVTRIQGQDPMRTLFENSFQAITQKAFF